MGADPKSRRELVGEKDIERVLEIARRFDVKCFLHPRFPVMSMVNDKVLTKTFGLKKAPKTSGWAGGPTAHACSLKTRSVWFEHLDPWAVETHLHEIMHVVLGPPNHNIDEFSEDVVLMPFERVIARQCLSKEAYALVVRWQLNTQIEWWDNKRGRYYGALEDVPNHQRWWYWRNSFDGLRRMGMLDENNRVTWKKPDWRRAPKALIERGNLTVPF
jgi:hypothetical protein